MYYSRKKVEEVPEELTEVWSCTNDGCNGWMRDNFAFAVEPTCQLCQSPMTKEARMLPQLVNTNQDQRAVRNAVK
ncbi:cold-shock protein [Paenibacillus sambharensis]|uniref:cold-shock protein n=1 Tax=Paenibacillus sambharensis TaxID=1803190 RepID=UPI0015E8B91F|nr:cold-shock protein [Paenibacillus sambharensis]